MSECVVRMEMPNGCHDCKLRNMVGNCPIPMFDGQDEKKIWTLKECFQRPPWCPILCKLPEGHGRLVDGDELYMTVKAHDTKRIVNLVLRSGFMEEKHICLHDICQAQTIVPAEAERSET